MVKIEKDKMLRNQQSSNLEGSGSERSKRGRKANLSLASWKIVGLRLGEMLELHVRVRSSNVSVLLCQFCVILLHWR